MKNTNINIIFSFFIFSLTTSAEEKKIKKEFENISLEFHSINNLAMIEKII